MTREEKYEFLKENWGKEMEFSDDSGFESSVFDVLVGVDVVLDGPVPFITVNSVYSYCRPKPKPTWRETLKEKLKDYPKHFALVCSYMAGKDLDREFTKWFDFEANWTGDSISFDWSSTEEGNDWWDDVYMFLIGKSKDLPPLPKKERYLTSEELLGKTITNGEYKVIVTSIEPDNDEVYFSCRGYSNPVHETEELHEDGWTLEDGSPLLVEDNEGGE